MYLCDKYSENVSANMRQLRRPCNQVFGQGLQTKSNNFWTLETSDQHPGLRADPLQFTPNEPHHEPEHSFNRASDFAPLLLTSIKSPLRDVT